MNGPVEATARGRVPVDYRFLVAVSTAVLAIDWASKVWARHKLPGFLDTFQLFPHVTIVLKPNVGGALGMLARANPATNRIAFSLLSLIAGVVVISLYRRLQARARAFKWGLPLVLGGAIGNLLDRLRFGYVLDFVDLNVEYRGLQQHAPYFNLADVAIAVGVGLLAVEFFLRRRGRLAAMIMPLLPLWPGCGGDGAPFVGTVTRSQFWEYHDQVAEPLCPTLLSVLDDHTRSIGAKIGLSLEPGSPFRYYKFRDEETFAASHRERLEGETVGTAVQTWRPFQAHEQAHAYVFRAWGGYSTQLLYEGEAVALSCDPIMEPVAATTPRQLFGTLDWRAHLDAFSFSPDEYAAAGFFVTHLARRYGWDRVAQLHRGAPPGISQIDLERVFAEVFPISMDEAWADALDAPGAPGCDKDWICRSTPLPVGEHVQPDCDGQLHRTLTVDADAAGIVLDVADDRGITLSGRCADSGAPWYPLPGTASGAPTTHWALVPAGTYSLFAGASQSYLPPDEPVPVTDGEFTPSVPAPADILLRSSIPSGTLGPACGSPAIVLNSDAKTTIDLVHGFDDVWIGIDGGDGSFAVTAPNLFAPLAVSEPLAICDSCGPGAACTSIPTRSIPIGPGAYLHLQGISVDRPPAAGQIVFQPTLAAP